jgi:chromosome segregation ATPase
VRDSVNTDMTDLLSAFLRYEGRTIHDLEEGRNTNHRTISGLESDKAQLTAALTTAESELQAAAHTIEYLKASLRVARSEISSLGEKDILRGKEVESLLEDLDRVDGLRLTALDTSQGSTPSSSQTIMEILGGVYHSVRSRGSRNT